MGQRTIILREGLETGDLKRLVHTELHIDQYKSKLGPDADIVVLSFKVKSKLPGNDLVNFIEKGYSWVIDADVSAGEMDDGDYLVFVECERNRNVPSQIMSLLTDLMNVTEQRIEDWRFAYRNDPTEYPLDAQNLANIIPASPGAYIKEYGVEQKSTELKDEQKEKSKKQDKEKAEKQRELDQLKTAAGVKVDTKAPKNEVTENLRKLAGLM